MCPVCNEGVRLVRLNSLARCGCGALCLYGQPENPTVGCSKDCELTVIDSIGVVDDDYVAPATTGGKLVLNPKAGTVYGMPKDVIDTVLPLLTFAKECKWTDRKLLEACHALIRYDKLLGKSLDHL